MTHNLKYPQGVRKKERVAPHSGWLFVLHCNNRHDPSYSAQLRADRLAANLKSRRY